MGRARRDHFLTVEMVHFRICLSSSMVSPALDAKELPADKVVAWVVDVQLLLLATEAEEVQFETQDFRWRLKSQSRSTTGSWLSSSLPCRNGTDSSRRMELATFAKA